MTAPLQQADRTRLVKLLSMLGSDHAGERDAAALAAVRLLRKCGLTWDEALSRKPNERRLPELGTWRATAAKILESGRWIRPWEREFLIELRNFPHISSKQRYILCEIARRVLGENQ